MFFVISKILHFLIDPLLWIVIIFLWGLLTGNQLRKKKLIITSFISLFLFTNPFVINELMQWWEFPSVKKSELNRNYEAGIVLGGMIKYYNSEMERANFGAGADRLMQTVDLYNSGKIKKIIISGGSGKLNEQNFKEAEIVKEMLLGINLSSDDILIEENSRNTYENAKYTLNLMQRNNLDGPFLLITSAFHMRRAIAVFNKQGISVDAFPVDALSGRRTFTPDKLIIPSAEALIAWNVLFHELLGFLVYKIMGYA